MTVLVAYDGSDPSEEAIEHAITHYGDEDLLVLHVFEAAGGTLGAGIELAREALKGDPEERDREISETIEDLLSESDLTFRVETVTGSPAREIVQYAEDEEVEHIVLGSHGRAGVSRVLLGSVAEKVVRRSPTPVTVVR